MKKGIALIPGDGIGPEIVAGAVTVLDAVCDKFNHEFEYITVDAGGVAIDKYGDPLPNESLEKCLGSDSILLGAVGGKKWDTLPANLRPERALLALRKELNLFANIRPAVLKKQLNSASPLKNSVIGDGLDIVVVRELTGGIYFGDRKRESETAYDTERYSVAEIKRIAKVAFETARLRKRHVTSVDKANILASSQLWRDVVSDLHKDYPDVELNHMYVDNAAMQLVTCPSQFDVIVTSNMFGDILSDLSSAIAGSIGMLPSASLGDNTRGMYEPIHGSAPDIAGMDIANPIATIVSAAMMLEMSFGMTKEAKVINNAIDAVLDAGYRTADIYSEGTTKTGTVKMANLIAKEILK